MDLSPRQLSSLKTMGVPVWEFRSTISNDSDRVDELSGELIDQLSQCNCWVMVESQLDEQTNTLLNAMLFAIGLTAADFVVINPKHFEHVQQLNLSKKFIFSLGEQVIEKVNEQNVNKGEIVVLKDFSLLISHSLPSIISKPLLKAEVWKHLRLVKHELLAC
mgnify:FL=1